jgi:hypothetical protein
MPVDVLTLPGSSISTKWKEPYASASINQKLAGIVAPGIYRGLRMIADPLLGDRTVVVQADSDRGDHVAVYENADGYSVTYRDSSSGDITLSLTAYTSTTVIVTVFVDYTPGVSTTGSFRVYTQAEFSILDPLVREALVILGTVTVPASGPISASSISLLQRTLASSNIPSGSVINAPLVRNPGFEAGEVNGTYGKSSVFWDKEFTVGTGTWKTSTTVVDTGSKSIEVNATSIPVTGDLSQQIGVETEEGELFVVSVRLQQLKTVSSGAFVFFMEWADVNDALLTTTLVSLDGGAVDSAFRDVETIVAAPAGAVSLRAIGIRATALSPSTTGIFAYIDGVNVFVNTRDTRYPYAFEQAFRQPLATTGLRIGDKTGGFSALASTMRFDSTTPASEGRLVIEQPDSSDLPPALQLIGRLYKLGSGLLNTDANALKPRISWDNGESVQRTLLWESAGDASGIPVIRQYVDSGGHAQITANARFDGANWNKDINGQEAFSFTVSKFGIVQAYQIAGTNTWADVAWVPAFDLTSSGVNTDLLMVANKHVTVQGTGRYKHGTRTKRIQATLGQFRSSSTASVTWFSDGSGMMEPTTGISGFTYDIPISLEVGKRILAVRYRVKDHATGPTRFSCGTNAYSGYNTSTGSIGSGTVVSAGTGADQTLVQPGLPVGGVPVLDNFSYVSLFNVFTGVTGPVFIYCVEVDYDEP